MLGPIDYIVVGFSGNEFDGSILKELTKAVESNTIRILDLVFVVKGADGTFTGGEFADQPEELQAPLRKLAYADDTPLFTEDDIEKVAESMDNDTAAAVLVIEQVWAKGLKKALLDANGVLVAEGRIHPDNVEAALEDLAVAL